MTASSATPTAATSGGPAATCAVRIRPATVADAPVVRTLLLELADHEHSTHAVHATTEDWRRMLAEPSVLVLLAFSGDRPVGYVSGLRQLNLWNGREVFAMDDLYVRAEARDRGIGGRLMAALAERVAAEELLITWGVDEGNVAGQRFYQRLGATLRTKTVAAWRPEAYTGYLRDR